MTIDPGSGDTLANRLRAAMPFHAGSCDRLCCGYRGDCDCDAAELIGHVLAVLDEDYVPPDTTNLA